MKAVSTAAAATVGLSLGAAVGIAAVLITAASITGVDTGDLGHTSDSWGCFPVPTLQCDLGASIDEDGGGGLRSVLVLLYAAM